MFFIRHPKPVVDSRAVAVLVVQQKITREPVRHVLVAPENDPAKVQVAVPGAAPARQASSASIATG